MKKIGIKRSYLAMPYTVYLMLFIFIPMLFIIYFSFVDSKGGFTFDNIVKVLTSSESIGTFLLSIFYGAITTGICFLLGYPVAYILSQKRFKMKNIIIVLFILPMWVNFMIRTLALEYLFESLNITLGAGTAMFGLVYDFLPFMILPIYTTLLKIDKNLIEASEDLGANPKTVLFKTILPLSVPGIISGALMVFMPSITAYAITETLSDGTFNLIGNLINMSFFNNKGYSSALAIVMLVLIFISMMISYKFNDKSELQGGGLW
ncbi:MAG: ABC transporter permease [Clostridiales bacterium]|jgi:spermidine/putrescine transport system permease protein|nr:ABC transporter permease [Clostridiales bacterium]